MEIVREKYLHDLINKQHNGLVKVITGIRRSGKSYLLFKLYYDYLLSTGVKESQIIKLSLDDDLNSRYRNPNELSTFIRSKILDSNHMYYIFIDEIQFVKKIKNPYLDNDFITFYDVLNGLLKIKNVDIYVTGSNSKMLSKDVLTEFRGRGDEVHVYPLSFLEFFSIYHGDKYDAWLEYYTYGGLPAIINFNDENQKINYLTNLFNETYIKDILERNKIKNHEELEDLLNILSSSIGSLTNSYKLSKTYKVMKNIDIHPATIKSYLDIFEDSYIISKTLRYDVKVKKYINTPAKYYFTDLGLRNARLNFRQQEENHIMENIIYNELIYRGYHVDVGIVEINEKQENGNYTKKQLEVDFIANKGDKRYYIQSAFNLSTEEKIKQEKRSLINIDDSFKKIVVVKDRMKISRDDYGIVTMDIFEFLLNPDSLEL